MINNKMQRRKNINLIKTYLLPLPKTFRIVPLISSLPKCNPSKNREDSLAREVRSFIQMGALTKDSKKIRPCKVITF